MAISRRHARPARWVAGLASAALVATGFTVAAAPAAVAVPIGPNDFRISDMGPNLSSGFEAQQQAAAYSPADDRYLVVWRGDEQGDLQAEIYGQFVDARTGADVGPNDFLVARIGSSGVADTDAIEPAVVYNPTRGEYLVVFAGDEALDPLPPTIIDTFEIYAQRVSAGGAAIGSPLRLSDMGADPANGNLDANSPSVAYNATADTYLVTWRGDDDTPPFVNGDVEIWGQMLGYSGGTLTEVGANDFGISNMQGPPANSAHDARNGPAVAWNSTSNTFLVAWDGDGLATDNEFEVFGQALSGTGTPIGPDDFRISNTGPDGSTEPEVFFDDLAYNATSDEYLVTWSADPATNNDFEIYGQRLSGATRAEVGGDTRLTTTGPEGATSSPAQYSSVAHNPTANEYYLVWEAGGPGLGVGEVEVFGQRLTTTLATRENASQLTDVGPNGVTGEKPNTPGVVYSGRSNNGYLLSWNGPDSPNLGPGESEIFGQLLASSSDLRITKSVSDTSPAPGQTITYTLNYANSGPDTAYGVVITDQIPPTLTGVSFTTAGASAVARAGSQYVWDVASLAPGASGSITVTATVAAGLLSGNAINNTATISTTTQSVDLSAGNNSASANSVVDAPASVTVNQAVGQADPTNGSPIVFTATFSESVTGLTNSDVLLGGTATGTTATVSGGPTTYTISVGAGAVGGTITASLGAGAAEDSGGNGSRASTSTDNTVTYDLTSPSVSLSSSASPATATSPIPVTATFSEDVTGFTQADVVGGNATVGGFAGGPKVFTFTLTPTADGVVTADVAQGAATDIVGNGNRKADQLAVRYDTAAPSVSLSSSASPATATSPIPVTATFSEDVTGFTQADVVGGNATVGGFAGGPKVFTFTLTPTADGVVTADVAQGVATDIAGNGNRKADQLAVRYARPTPVPSVTPVPPVPPVTPVKCLAKAVSKGSKLKVKMGPSLPGEANYAFRLISRRGGNWQSLKQYQTKGKAESRTINVTKGTYRAKCYGRGFPNVTGPQSGDSVSAPVTIKR